MDITVTGRRMFAENDVSGLFSAQAVTVLCHILIDILVTNGCLFVADAGFVACFVQAKVCLLYTSPSPRD